MIKKIKGGWETVHCHGSDKDKPIAKFKTKEDALAQHKAIMASKAKRNALDKIRKKYS